MNRSWNEQRIKLNMKKYRQDHDKVEKSWSFFYEIKRNENGGKRCKKKYKKKCSISTEI